MKRMQSVKKLKKRKRANPENSPVNHIQNKKNIITSLNFAAFLIIALLITLTFLTKYYGSTDVGDYADVGKYFAGEYSAKIRGSHSYVYGFALSPFLAFMHNFIVFKIASLVFLLLIIYSVYYVSGKNKKAFWLMLISPIIWYTGPWISPIPLSAFLFFWAYVFLKRFEESNKIKHLMISGILAGASLVFWDAMMFFTFFLGVSFLYNKKFSYFFGFFLGAFVGLMPRLVFEQYFLGFAFSGIIRYAAGVLTAIFYGGIYEGGMPGYNLLSKIGVLIMLPFFTYKLFSKEGWLKNKKVLIFLIIGALLMLENSQMRYTLLMVPIIIFELAPKLNDAQFKKQMIISSVILLIVILPYEIQIKYSTNIEEFQELLNNYEDIKIYENKDDLISKDLEEITKEFPNEVFVVGNAPDDYGRLAHNYWENEVNEFVSVQDYNLYFENRTNIFEKKFMPSPRINDRRQIWIAGGINKNEDDATDYSNISLGIGVDEPLNLPKFMQIKKYQILYLSKKE